MAFKNADLLSELATHFGRRLSMRWSLSARLAPMKAPNRTIRRKHLRMRIERRNRRHAPW